MMKRLVLGGLPLLMAAALVAPAAAQGEAASGAVRAELLVPRLAYAPGEPLTVLLTLEGVGRGSVTVPEECLKGDTFRLLESSSRREMKPGRLKGSETIELAPGGKFSREVRLDKLFGKLKKPGRYELSWSCRKWRSRGETFVVARPYDPEQDRIAVIRTNLGEMTFVLMPETAPQHVENFVRLAHQGYYDGVQFVQIMPGIQAETGDASLLTPYGWRHQTPPEIDKALVPLRGMIGALRRPSSRSTMTSAVHFFVLLETQPGFRGLHTFFAYLEKGEDVLAAIGGVPVSGGSGANAFRPLEPVRIESITIRPE